MREVPRLRAARARVDPAVAALLLATTIWGATYVVTKIALPDVGPFTILLLRLVIGAAALAPFARRHGYRPAMSLQRRFVLFGLTGMVLHLGFEILGLRFTSAASAVLVIATAPVVTAAFSVAFLKERLSRRRSLGIALSVAGVALIAGAQSSAGYPLGWLGSLLVFAGVVTWGMFTVQGKRLATTHTWLVTTTAATGAAVLLTLPLSAAEIALEGPPDITWSALTAVVYLGLFAQAVAYGLWNLALEHVDASVAGPYINLVPVIGLVLALAVGDAMMPMQVLGGATVAFGVWLNHDRSGNSRARSTAAAASVPDGPTHVEPRLERAGASR